MSDRVLRTSWAQGFGSGNGLWHVVLTSRDRRGAVYREVGCGVAVYTVTAQDPLPSSKQMCPECKKVYAHIIMTQGTSI